MDLKTRVRNWIEQNVSDGVDPKTLDRLLEYTSESTWHDDAWLLSVQLWIMLHKQDTTVEDDVRKFILQQAKLLTAGYPWATREAMMEGS